MAKFQVKLGGEWKDYGDDDDKVLKQAYEAGLPTATLEWKGHTYVCNFDKMVQVNKVSGKEHKIRPPFKPKASIKSKASVGPTTVVNVPSGAPGTTMQVPHPYVKGAFIAVNVPASAKVGQAMLVPIPAKDVPAASPPSTDKHGKVSSPKTGTTAPRHGSASSSLPCDDDERPAEAAAQESAPPKEPPAHKGSGGWTTGGKIGAGLGVGGVAVAGAFMGVAAVARLADDSDVAGEAGVAAGPDAVEATEDVVIDASEFGVEGGEEISDSVVDLF